MADTKISLLTELAAASIDSADVLPIVDTSATETKKVSVASLDTRYITESDIAAKGDLFVGTADNTAGVLTVGANDTIPVADSTTGTGIKWAAPSVVRTALGLGNAATMTVDSDLPTFSVPASTTISAFGATLVDDADAATARTTLGAVGLSGNETVAGVKTFSSDPLIPDEVYGVGWNGSLEPPTKNAVYDKIETMGGGSGIRVEDEGTSIVAAATGINFAGAGVVVTDAGSNEALVTISGGGGGGGTSLGVVIYQDGNLLRTGLGF